MNVTLRLHGVEAGVGEFLRYEVAAGYLHFLLGDISAELNDLHTVEERPRNGVEVVGGGNEHHVREVVVDVEIVVVERLVLFGVEDLEECRCRIAVDGVLRHLVDLVEDERGCSSLPFADSG